MLKYNFWNSAAPLKCILLCPAVVGVGDAGDSPGVTSAETVFDPPPEIEIVISDVKVASRFFYCNCTSNINGLWPTNELCTDNNGENKEDLLNSSGYVSLRL